MLRKALNVSWQEHIENKNLYGNLPPVSVKVRARRMRIAGHNVRHPELSANPLILWEPTQGKSNRGRRRLTYIDMIRKDTGLKDKNEIKAIMLDREVWREINHTNAREED